MHGFQTVGVVVSVEKTNKARLVIVRYGASRNLDESKGFDFINANYIRIPDNVWDGADEEIEVNDVINVVGNTQGVIRRSGGSVNISNELVATKLWKAAWMEGVAGERDSQRSEQGGRNHSASSAGQSAHA